jgi:DNA polymerase I-like protein with 3'-5' exonuclease and polymerase domains
VQVLADMETEGIRIDIPALKQFSEELGVELLRLQEQIHRLWGALQHR